MRKASATGAVAREAPAGQTNRRTGVCLGGLTFRPSPHINTPCFSTLMGLPGRGGTGSK